MSNIQVPQIAQQYSPAFSSDAVTTAGFIRSSYGQYIAAASASVGLDPNIAIGFMIIESGTGNGTVNPNATSPAGALGLLQLEPVTAWQTLENQAPAFTPDQSVLVTKYLPGYQKIGGFTGLQSTWLPQIKQLLTTPEFNIWVGIMQLAQMCKYIMKKTNDGTLHLDQVVIAYNAGQGNYSKYVYNAGLASADTTTIATSFPFAETVAYIVKLLGIGGSLAAAIQTDPDASAPVPISSAPPVSSGLPGPSSGASVIPTIDSSGNITF